MPRRFTWKRSDLLILLPVLYYIAILFKTSWICDDAYITFRTVDNFVHGFGPRWNIADRVQTFTNPLWMLAVSAGYFITREIYYTVTVLMFAASLATILILSFRIVESRSVVALGILILATSRAFTDYSTSGLENPMTHLLMAAFLMLYFRYRPGSELVPVGDRRPNAGRPGGERNLLGLFVLLSLAMVNRMDAGLLLAPAAIAAAVRCPRREAVRAVLAGMAPFIAWEIFAIVYYGFPFPNSAYAKLGAGVGTGALLIQGLSYLWNAVRWDPLQLLTILLGLAVVFSGKARRTIDPPSGNREVRLFEAGPGADLPVAIGVVLYLLYVVRIGGDFMSGRFLAAPLLCCVILLCRRIPPAPRLRPVHLLPVLAVLGLGFLSIDPPLLSGPNCGAGRTNLVDSRGISDERAYYYQGCGLLRAFAGCDLPCHFMRTRGLETRELGRQLITAEAIGLIGFYGGPAPHFIDEYGLADPFIARLSMKDKEAWRIGHMVREIPQDYIETVRTGHNVIRDARLRELHEMLSLIMRGPVWSSARWGAIIRMNLGGER